MDWVLVRSSAGWVSVTPGFSGGASGRPGTAWGGVEQAVITVINSEVTTAAGTIYFIVEIIIYN
jgi:hypothetical protein